MKQFIALLLLVMSPCGFAAEAGPRQRLDAVLAEPDEAGNVFAQARQFDHVEYRPMLRRALSDRAGLVELLQYNARTSLIGEGAEDHAGILVALLEAWGDEAFARALQSCTPEAAAVTLHFLEYAGATRERFPRTFAVPGQQ